MGKTVSNPAAFPINWLSFCAMFAENSLNNNADTNYDYFSFTSVNLQLIAETLGVF